MRRRVDAQASDVTERWFWPVCVSVCARVRACSRVCVCVCACVPRKLQLPIPSSLAAKAGQLRAVSELQLPHAVSVELANKQRVAHRDDPARCIQLGDLPHWLAPRSDHVEGLLACNTKLTVRQASDEGGGRNGSRRIRTALGAAATHLSIRAERTHSRDHSRGDKTGYVIAVGRVEICFLLSKLV